MSSPEETNRFAEDLRAWISSNYKSIKDFERASGIPYQSLMNYTRGVRSPSVEVLFKLRELGFDGFESSGKEYLLNLTRSHELKDCESFSKYVSGEGFPFLDKKIITRTKGEATQVPSTSVSASTIGYGKGNDLFAYVRVMDVSASAGQGSVVYSEDEEDQYAFNKRWLRMKGLTNAELSVIHVSGDSMEPVLGDSDVILVRHNCELVHGKIFVINHGGEIFVKRTKLTKAGWLMCSENPKYDPILIDENSAVIGLVVSSMRDI